MKFLFVPLAGALLVAPSAFGDLTFFDNFTDYNNAVGGVHDLFLDFETDSAGNPIANSIGDIDGNGTGDVLGSIFSDAIVYTSPDNGGFPNHVNIEDIAQGIDHEIGPMGTWDGRLDWAYSGDALFFATGFTGISVAPDATISFFLGGDLVDSGALGGTGETFQFFGVVSTNNFDSVSVNGNFFAIDAHYSSIPGPGGLAAVALLAIGHRRRRA